MKSPQTLKYTPIKVPLTISFLALIATSIIALSVIDYLEAKSELLDNFQLSMRQSENDIFNAVQLVDIGYQLLEKTLDATMEKEFLPFLQAYKTAGGDPKRIDLLAIKKQLPAGMDLYIINAQGVVEYTTYSKDIGLDFKQFPDIYQRLSTIRQGNVYVGDRIATEIRTGKLRKFAYFPTPDHRYILELGLKSDEFQVQLASLDTLKFARQLKTFNPYLEDVKLFNHKATLLGNPGYKVDDATKQLIKKLYLTKKSHQKTVGQTIIRYIVVGLNFEGRLTDTSKIVKLTYNTERIDQQLQKKALNHFLFAAVAIIICVFVTLLLASWITKPINKIIQDVDQIAQGNLDHPIEVHTQNELKLLKDSVQIMVSNMREQMDYISLMNQANSRFVPHEFLKHLGKDNIVEVELGNSVECHMSVLFSDLRSFTSISETMTPEENFKFLNGYLHQMGPIIREYGGFVDKYIGDAIMALFDHQADDALHSAIAMLKTLNEYNSRQNTSGRPPIAMGIGIHTGTLILGTIGEKNRMETTVISDAVNLAARLEGMTKMYGVSLIISDTVFHNLNNPEPFATRIIDRVQAKGKKESVTILEVYNGDPPEIFDKKLNTQREFEEGISLYHLKRFEEAKKYFEHCLSIFAEDRATEIYIKRCDHYIAVGWDDSWDGVVQLETK